MGARYYNPEIGRFITRDTYRGDIYKPWTQNLYTYCNNNPVNYVDPTGHVVEKSENQYSYLSNMAENDPDEGNRQWARDQLNKKNYYTWVEPSIGESIIDLVKEIVPDAGGMRINASAGALVSGGTSGDFLYTGCDGFEATGSYEVNGGPQTQVGLTWQGVASWNVNSAKDLTGEYETIN